jgi:hypothetical protein
VAVFVFLDLLPLRIGIGKHGLAGVVEGTHDALGNAYGRGEVELGAGELHD